MENYVFNAWHEANNDDRERIRSVLKSKIHNHKKIRKITRINLECPDSEVIVEKREEDSDCESYYESEIEYDSEGETNNYDSETSVDDIESDEEIENIAEDRCREAYELREQESKHYVSLQSVFNI